MDIPLVNMGYPLLLSPFFLQQVDDILEKNADEHTQTSALLLSRLIKGLQNLSNLDPEVDYQWGKSTYLIDDIGIVTFRPFMDLSNHQLLLAIDRIDWVISESYLFSRLQI